MTKILALLISLCFFVSCEKKEPNFSKEMIEKLAYMQEDEKLGLLPSRYLSFDLYVLKNDKEVCKTNNHDLFFYYKKNYLEEFSSFEFFLNAVLNEDFVLDKIFKDMYSFKLNQKIEKECITFGFDKFLKKYSEPSNKKGALELNKLIIKSGEYLTANYLMYKNKYDIGRDCYIGKDYIKKREDSFK